MNGQDPQRKLFALIPLLVASNCLAQSCEWSPGAILNDSNDYITALGVFGLGDTPKLYAGGWFHYLDGRLLPYFARLDDDAGWGRVGGGLDGPAECFALHNDGTGPSLYVGGGFNTAGDVEANSIARWDGESWHAIGHGLEHGVFAMAFFDDGTGPTLYAGGQFVYSWPNMTRYFARWDGKYWRQVGTMGSSVQALQVWDDGAGPALYVGGEFTKIDGKPMKGIARWDGQAWSDVGGSPIGKVWALTEFDDGTGMKLYAGGGGGVNRWDGQDWSVVPGLDDVYVITMTVTDDVLYVGGARFIDGDQLAVVLRWDGNTVDELGTGRGEFNGWVSALAQTPDGSLYAGGGFLEFDAEPILNFAKYDCTPCPADCDASGSLDLFDYLCFLNAFNAADPAADCDASGSLDAFDYFCFKTHFENGCP